MSRYLRVFALVAVLALVATACGGDDEGEGEVTGPTSTTGVTGEFEAGGTLQLATPADVSSGWDPAKEYEAVAWEFYRCCFTRTLMTYTGAPGTAGVEPVPDLAAAEPEVSVDGLTWVFTIKQGIHYAPPFQDREITAEDFITALERLSSDEGSAGGYPFYFTDIEGFDDADGATGAITGLTALDPYTLQITLTRPLFDLNFRFAMPATAPVPAEAAEGHIKDYGRFLVSSGPYMFEGSEALDFSLPAEDQEPVTGYQPTRAWILVRNPSWVAERDTDEVRAPYAYADRIEVAIGGEEQDLLNKVDAGELDMVYGMIPTPEYIEKYKTEKPDQLLINVGSGTRYITMNVAEPPFDDIHVRKAVQWVIDKDGLRRFRGGPDVGGIATHYVLDSLTGDINAGYDPYATPDGVGDVEQAKAEMAQSKYDTNQDGVCDAPECEGFLMPVDQNAPYPDQTALLVDNLSQIGLVPEVVAGDRYTVMYSKCQDPAAHAAFCPSVGWFWDWPDALSFVEPIFGSVGIGSSNYSELGLTPEQLKENGYEVTEVPSVDAMIEECKAAPVGDEQIACWAEFDQYQMEEIASIVPWLWDNNVDIIGPRVIPESYVYDQSSGLVAIEKLALVGGGA